MQRTIDDHGAWQEVPVDEVPVNALVRYDDRGERLVGTVVDELATPGATALVVLDAEGAPRVVPVEARLEMRVSGKRLSTAGR